MVCAVQRYQRIRQLPLSRNRIRRPIGLGEVEFLISSTVKVDQQITVAVLRLLQASQLTRHLLVMSHDELRLEVYS
jgi:hypothetical protein